jgi:hypothetical protein
MWQGWLVAGANSLIICMIGFNTGQWGFVPANIFCLALYFYNLRNWRTPASAVTRAGHAAPATSATLDGQLPAPCGQ